MIAFFSGEDERIWGQQGEAIPLFLVLAMVAYVQLHFFFEPLIQAILIGGGRVTVLLLFQSLGSSVCWHIDMVA